MSENTMYVWEMVKEAVESLGRPLTFMTFIFCSVFLIQCSENRAQMHDIVINEKTIAHSILICDMEQLTSPFEKSVNYLMILPSFVIDNFESFHFQPNHSEEKYLFQRNGLQFWKLKNCDLHIILLPANHIPFSDTYFDVLWDEGYFSQNRVGAYQLTSHDFYISDKIKYPYCDYQCLFQSYINIGETIKRDLSQNFDQ